MNTPARQPLTLYVSEVAVEIDGLPPEAASTIATVWAACREPILPTSRRVAFLVEERADGWWIFRDGKHVGGIRGRANVHRAFEQTLYESLIEWHPPPRVILHAAGVALGDEVLVLTGVSGAGKSSMARALVTRGGRYLSDELVVTDGRQLWGIPRAIQFDPIFLDTPPPDWLGTVDLESYRMSHEDGRTSAQPLFPLAADAVAPGPYPAARARIVVLARAEEDSVEELTPVEALAALHENRFSPLGTDLGVLAGARQPLRLGWRTPDSAADKLSALAEGAR